MCQLLLAALCQKLYANWQKVAVWLGKMEKATGFNRRWLLKGLGCKSQANPELEAYLSKANTDCADWLACANIAVAACVIICALAKLVLSLA